MYLFMYVYKDIYIYVYIMYLYIHIHAHLFLFVQVHQCLLTSNFLCLSKTAKTVRSPLVAELLHRLFFSSNHSPGWSKGWALFRCRHGWSWCCTGSGLSGVKSRISSHVGRHGRAYCLLRQDFGTALGVFCDSGGVPFLVGLWNGGDA